MSIASSPFQPPLQGTAPPPTSPSKLTDAWQSQSDFCGSFGGRSSVCLSGDTVSFNAAGPSPSPRPEPRGVCLERIDNGSYLSLAPHPDGSSRIFLGSQAGKIWLATVPEQGSGGALQFEGAGPFVDLTDQVHFDSALGLMGMAFHPGFATNGRFFASYNCDRTKSPSCTGRCSCNSDVGCDPSKLGTDSGAQPCQYQVVVSEYSARGSAAVNVSQATSAADPSEVRRIFAMGLPYTSGHGGQVLFGPADGYLYLMLGDGGKGDPFNFAQNKKSLLGKIVRLDVDSTPSSSGGDLGNTSLWGNYSIPKDNPYADDSELEPEIWALGLRNPWRCSFDSERPSYFYCGDVGQDAYEESRRWISSPKAGTMDGVRWRVRSSITRSGRLEETPRSAPLTPFLPSWDTAIQMSTRISGRRRSWEVTCTEGPLIPACMEGISSPSFCFSCIQLMIDRDVCFC